MTFAALEAHLQAEADERLFATGGQLYVSLEGVVLTDHAVGVDGVDTPVTPDTLFAIYCSGKPAVALGLASLIDDGELSLDDRLGDLLEGPIPNDLAPVLVRQVLDHTAGLHHLDPMTYITLPVSARDQVLSVCAPPAGWRVGHQVGYSPVLGWHVLGLVIEALQPDPLRDFVRRRVLEPLGIDADLHVGGMSDHAFDVNRGRLGVNTFLYGPSSSPILIERLRRFRCLNDPSGATTGNARALGRFYEAVLAILRGHDGVVSRPLLEQLVAPHSYGYDQGMGRECGYGYGFMVGLADHEFGYECGARAFGHSAYGGMTAGFCDPDLGLVVAFHFNGRIDAETAISHRRPALVNRIYRAALSLETAGAHA